MSIDFKVGQELKAIRQAKHMSQAYVSEGICSINTLVRIESNTQSPSFELMVALVNRMGISINTLIDATNYERNTFYYTLKDNMETALSSWHWTKLKELVNLLQDDVYASLPVVEQQFVDIMRIEVAKFVDKDFTHAHQLARQSLAKTFNERSAEFYSSEEMTLFYIIFQFDQRPKQLEQMLKAIEWIEAQPQAMQDYASWMRLMTGVMLYNYEHRHWQESLKYAMKGYDVAITKDKFRFVPNFLFMRGMCLYQTRMDIDQGITDMKTALQFCIQFGMHEAYHILTQDLETYEIDLKDN